MMTLCINEDDLEEGGSRGEGGCGKKNKGKVGERSCKKELHLLNCFQTEKEKRGPRDKSHRDLRTPTWTKGIEDND